MLSILPLIVFLVKSAAADVLFVGLNERKARKAAMQEGDALFVVGGKHENFIRWYIYILEHVYLYYLFDKLQYQNKKSHTYTYVCCMI